MATSRIDRVEVVTHVERRRRFTSVEKLRYVAETFEPGSSVAAVAKKYGLAQGLVFGWRRAVRDGRLGPDFAVSANAAEMAVPAVSPFIRVQTSASEATASMIRVTFPNDVVLELPVAMAPDRIAAVMQAIRGQR